jgi:hypothetical protein
VRKGEEGCGTEKGWGRVRKGDSMAICHRFLLLFRFRVSLLSSSPEDIAETAKPDAEEDSKNGKWQHSVRRGVSKRVEEATCPETPETPIRPFQGVEGPGMAGPGDKLESPWPPHTVRL